MEIILDLDIIEDSDKYERIIRCYQCKYWNAPNGHEGSCDHAEYATYYDFCRWAKKKE